MYKLYWSAMAGSLAPQALLEEVGAEYEKIVIDYDNEEHKSPEFLAVNPMGQIPALVLPDGSLMTESAAMMVHITDRHPEAKLAPTPGSPESAQFLRWLNFMSSSLYGGFIRTFYADKFTTDGSAQEEITRRGLDDTNRFFDILNDALDPGPYLVGETFSAADLYLWMLSHWHPERQQLLDRCPRINRHADLFQSRPAIVRIWPEHEGA